jgi:hypothetical protein
MIGFATGPIVFGYVERTSLPCAVSLTETFADLLVNCTEGPSRFTSV